jgi:hypothetical protein
MLSRPLPVAADATHSEQIYKKSILKAIYSMADGGSGVTP